MKMNKKIKNLINNEHNYLGIKKPFDFVSNIWNAIDNLKFAASIDLYLGITNWLDYWTNICPENFDDGDTSWDEIEYLVDQLHNYLDSKYKKFKKQKHPNWNKFINEFTFNEYVLINTYEGWLDETGDGEEVPAKGFTKVKMSWDEEYGRLFFEMENSYERLDVENE